MKFENLNNYIIILLIIVIIIILFYYKKSNDNFSDITSEMMIKIDSDLAKCFDITENENFELLQLLNYNFLQKNQTELLEKIKEITMQGLTLMTRYLRLYSLDFMCKNQNNSEIITNLHSLFAKQIKSLIIFHYRIFRISSNNTMQPLMYNNTKLLEEIKCIMHTKLSFNEQNILKDFDYIEFPETNNTENYSITGFTEEIYNLIIKKSKNQESNYCENVNINQSKPLIPLYRMHPLGELKQCKTSVYPEATSATTQPNTSNRYTTPSTFYYDDDPALSAPFYVPFQQTPSPNPLPTTNQNRNNEGNNSKAYIAFPFYKNINLENTTGYNNFFLPNIMVDS